MAIYLAFAKSSPHVPTMIVHYLLTLALGTIGALLAVTCLARSPHPLLVAGGLAVWLPLYAWSLGAALDTATNYAVPCFLGTVVLVGAGRAFVPHRSMQGVARVPWYRWPLFGFLAILAGGYVAEVFVRTQAEEVLGFFAPALLEADRTGTPMTSGDIRRILKERFGLAPESLGDRDRCTWQAFVHTYELTFFYDSGDGTAACSRVMLTPVPRWKGWLQSDR